MATYQKTIIIESNKQSALAAERGENIELTGLFDESDEVNTGNNRWETHIPDGLPLQIGDTINLESSMINAVGGGDSVIELTGFTGNQVGGNRIRDNKQAMKIAYYVTNAQQFNFNLPKSRHQTCYNVKKARYGSYANTYGDNFTGAPAANPTGSALNNQHFYSFEKSYPYQFVEGVGTQLGTNSGLSVPYEYKSVKMDYTNAQFNGYLPSYASGSRRVCIPNERRFYIGEREYTGSHYINEVNIQVPEAPAGTVYSYAVGTRPWDYLTKEIEFDIEKGFLTPSSLAAKLTEQLHERTGQADDFTEENEEALIFRWGNRVDGVTGTDTGILTAKLSQGVTDQVNILVPTSTGKPMYRQFNFGAGLAGEPFPSNNPLIEATATDNWSARDITYEQSTGLDNPAADPNIFQTINYMNRGRGYLPNQGDGCYYSYIASARPEYMKAQSNLNINMAFRPKSQGGNPALPSTEHFTLWTGHRTFGGAGGQPPVPDCKTTEQRFPPHVVGSPEPPSEPIFIAGATGPSVVLKDNLPYLDRQAVISQNKPALPTDTFPFDFTLQTKTIKTWNPIAGDPVVTNILVNPTTKQILENSFRDYFVVYGKDANTVNPDDLGFRNAMAIELNFGRLDDQQSSFDNPGTYDIYGDTASLLSTCEVNIPSTYAQIFKASIAADATNPYNETGFQFEHKVGTIPATATAVPAVPNFTANTAYNYPAAQSPSLPGTAFGLEGRWYAEYYLPDEMTAEALYQGLPFRTDAQSRFQTNPNDSLAVQYPFERYKTEIYDNIPTDAEGKKLAFVPVCWKVQGTGQGATIWMGANSYFEWYYCWIYKARIPPNFKPIRKPTEIKTDAQYNNTFVQPLPYTGEYVGLSPSEYTCDLAQIVTTQKAFQTNVYVPIIPANPVGSGTFRVNTMPSVSPSAYVPFINVGATDPLIKFDDSQGRFAISQFHTPLKEGNGTFQIPKIPSSSEPNNIQLAANFRRAMISRFNKQYNNPPNAAMITPFDKIESEANTLINALSGIGIIEMRYFTDNVAGSQDLVIRQGGRDIYTNTLFSKMGFSLEQLIPYFGTSNAQFNRANYNQYLGFRNGINPYLKYNNMVKPFTTNAFISATVMMGLARLMAFSDIPTGTPANPFIPTDSMFSPVPAENLGAIQPEQTADVQGESDELIALNLPKKLSYPYLVVRTNLILNPEYIGGKTGFEKLPAIAFITRNYSEGDYFYSFTTNWNYTVDLPYVVSSIITDIRLPDGRPAPIDDNSSVIYKINKLRTLPDVAGITGDEKKEMILEEKEKPKVMPQS